MANKTKGKNKKKEKKTVPETNEPWIGKQTGLLAMIILTVGFAIFMTWQLIPSEGFGGALLWGLGFALVLWAIFGLAFAFNSWVRGRRQ